MLKTYFIRGLLILTPIGVTTLIMMSIFEWISEKVESTELQGLTLITILTFILMGITLLGYLGSTYLIRPIGDKIDNVINKIPFVSLIYTSIKDLSSAFMGDKKKFDQPVIVKMDANATLHKPGFITRTSLQDLGEEDLVAVYFPHSYNFSGNVFFTENKNIKAIPNISPGEFMKFIVSGGVTGKFTDG